MIRRGSEVRVAVVTQSQPSEPWSCPGGFGALFESQGVQQHVHFVHFVCTLYGDVKERDNVQAPSLVANRLPYFHAHESMACAAAAATRILKRSSQPADLLPDPSTYQAGNASATHTHRRTLERVVSRTRRHCPNRFQRPFCVLLFHVIASTLRRVLDAFREHRVGSNMFAGVDGYGHGDIGRETLDKVYARLFGAEAALVSESVLPPFVFVGVRRC